MLFAIALASRLPSLEAPIALDDYTQRGLIEGQVVPGRSPWNLYDFIDHTNHHALVDRGMIPWWTDTPGPVARFLRPIPSLLVWLDYRVAGYDGLFPHLHGLLWWMLASAAFYALVRDRFSARVALLATAAFACSPGHTVPILWPANRGALVTVAFGCLALRTHLRTREGGRGGLLSAVCWAATFLTGEYALCFSGYVLAIEFARRGESLARRLRVTLPFLLTLLGYLSIRVVLGYSVRESLFYRNPLEEPVEFLRNLPRAFLVLVGSGWFGIDDLYSRSLATPTLASMIAASSAATVAALWLTLRRMKWSTRSDALWLGTGSLLSLVPVLSATASMRVIAVSAPGIAACTALLLDSALRTANRWRRASKVSADGLFRVAIALLFFYRDFIAVPADSHRFMTLAAREEPEFAKRLEWVQNNRPVQASTVVVLRGVTPPTAFEAPYMLREYAPERFRVLSQAQGRVVVVRAGPRELVLMQDGNEPLVHFGVGDRVRATPFTVGELIHVPGMTARIDALDEDGLPRQLHFEFDHDLEDPSYWWITEGADGFRQIGVPPLARGIRLLP